MDELISIVGYGTFLTKGYWKGKKNVEPCLVRDYIRILPEGYWYPFALYKKGASFWALKFDITVIELDTLDIYEGVAEKLYDRILINVELEENRIISAYLYVPSQNTIQNSKLTTDLDEQDRWREKLLLNSELISQFPILFRK